MTLPEFDYSSLAPEERAYMKSLAPLPDDAVWARADAGDLIAWLEHEARHLARAAAWHHARDNNHSNLGPAPGLRTPVWVHRALEARKAHAPQPAPRRGRLFPPAAGLAPQLYLHDVALYAAADNAQVARDLDRIATAHYAADRGKE